MAAFNFPNSPSTNDLHTENGVTYKWNGTVWKRQNASYTDATNLNVTGIATFANNVSIGGVLTYEDVKNVDSVGIVTARTGLKVLAGGANIVGVSTISNSELRITSGGAYNTHLNYSNVGTNYITSANGTGTYFRGSSNNITSMVVLGTGQVDIESKLRHIGDTDTLMEFGTDTITFDTAGSERLRISAAGKVLIGDGSTYSANGLLHIVGDDNSNGPELYLQVNNNNTTDNIGALWFGNNVDKSLVKLAGHTHTANNTADFTVSTSSGGTLAERLRITSDGKFSVGDSTPSVSAIFQRDQTTHHYLRVENLNSNSNYTAFSLKTPQLDFQLWNQGPGGSGYGGANSVNFYQGAATGPYCFFHGTSERLRIATDGKIGINNNAPLYQMHFKNAMASSPSWIHMEVTGSNTVGGGGGIAFDTSASNNATNNSLYLATVKGIRNSADDGSNDLVFSTSRNGVNGDDGNQNTPLEKLRINSHGRVLIGHSSARIASSTVNPIFQLEGTDHHSALGVIRNSSSAYGSYLVLGKSRSASVGGYTILQDNDQIGSIRFAGADGVDMAQYAAEIQVQVDGTPGADSMPGEMIFRTNTGSGNPTEKLRITKQGIVSINDSTPESFATLQINNHTTNDAAQILLRGADMAQIIMRDDTGGTNTKCTTIRNDQGALLFGTHNDSFSGFSEKLRITSGGSLIVGNQTSTSYKLCVSEAAHTRVEVISTSNNSAGAWFKVYNGGSIASQSTIRTSGGSLQVYTGTSSEAERLRITSDGEIRCTGAADNKGFAVWLDDNRRVAEIIEHSSDGEIRLYTGESTPVLRTVLTSYGNSYINAAGTGDVGIGTAIPSGKLNIVGSPSNALNIIQDTGNLSIRLNDRGSSSSYIKIPDGSGALTFETGGSERVRISSGGTLVIAGGANDTANVQLQDNNIGGVRITVNDEAISSAIYLPRDGAIVIITAFSNPDANGTNYPQPGSSGMAYVDCGPSRNIKIMDTGTTVGAQLVAKNAYTGTVSDCDNGKVTIMAGNTEGTFRIVNRRASEKYMFCITML